MSGGNAAIMTMFVWLALATAATAQTESSGSPQQPRELKLLRVPADAPSQWPSGDWREVRRETLEQFQQARRLPADAVLTPLNRPLQAEYVGRLEGDTLRGTCRFTTPETGSPATEILLDPLSLHLETQPPKNRASRERPAVVWGTRSDGKTVFVADENTETFVADWSATGKPVFDGTEFSLQLPLTAVNSLQLDLPRALQLSSSQGTVEGPLTTDDSERRVWRIHAGRRTHLILTCRPEERSRPAATPLVRESVFVTYQSDGNDILADYEFVGDRPTDLQFELPDGMRVVSATAGADIRVPFESRQNGATAELLVRLSREGGERDGRLRLRGFQTVGGSFAEGAPAPVPRLANAVVIDRQLTIAVQPPLLLQKFVNDGYQLTDRRTDADQAEVWAFQSLRVDSQLTVSAGTPPPRPRIEILTLADFRDEIAELQSRLRITGAGGPAFRLDIDVPSSWSIVDATTFRGDSTTVVAGFAVANGPKPEQRRLTIDLRQSLDPDEELDLLVTAVARSPDLGTSLAAPVFTPASAPASRSLLAIIPPLGAEVSAALSPLAKPLPPEMEARLGELSPATARPDVQLFDVTVTGPARQVNERVTFESSTASRDPMGETPAVEDPSMDVPRENALPSQGLPCGASRLTTYLAPAGGGMHVHEMDYLLVGPFRGPLQFSLAESCTHVELLADGQSVPMAQSEGVWKAVTDVTARQTLSIRYQTRAAGQTLSRSEAVPLPALPVGPLRFEWNINSVASRVCEQIDIPFSRVAERRSWPLAARYFGPLARDRERQGLLPAGEPAFERSTKGTLLTGGVPPSGVTLVEAGRIPHQILFTTWDPEFSERAAWAVLMVSLTTGISLRRTRWRALHRMLPLVLIIMAAASTLATDSYVPFCGAACVGWILAILIPRRLVVPNRMPAAAQPRDEYDEMETRSVFPASAVCLFWAVACSFLYGQDLHSQTRSDGPMTGFPMSGREAVYDVLLPERDGEPSGQAYLRADLAFELEQWQSTQQNPANWLLRHADYTIDVTDNAVVDIEFDLLVRNERTRLPVRLGLEGVTFTTAQSVEVDGKPGSIIPANQGSGIIVVLPGAAESDDPQNGVAVSAGWSPHRIVVHCRAPLVKTRAGEGFEIRVPPVASARLNLTTSNDELSTFHLSGPQGTEAVRGSLPLSLSVGGWNRIRCELIRDPPEHLRSSPMAPAASLVATSYELAPLRWSARTVLQFPVADLPVATRWTVPLQPGLTVLNVQFPPQLRSRIRMVAEQPVLDLELVDPQTDRLDVVIDSVHPLSTAEVAAAQFELRPIVTAGDDFSELVSLRATSGLEAIVEQAEVHSVADSRTMLSWPSDLLNRRNAAPDGLYQLTGELGILQVQLRPQTTQRSASVEMQLQARTGMVKWRAVASFDVQGAATPLHQWRLPAEIPVDRVAAVQDGADRLSRFARRGEILDLFLARPHSGPLRVELSGSIPVFGTGVVPVPELTLLDGEIDAAIWLVENESTSELELLRHEAVTSTLAGRSAGHEVAESTWTDRTPDRPTGLKLLPGADASTAETLTQVFKAGDVPNWQQRTTIVLRPHLAPLATVELRLPPGSDEELRIVPAADVVSQEVDANGERLLQLKPTRLRSGIYRVQIQSRIAPPAGGPVWEYAPISIPSATLLEQFIQVDADFPWRPTSATGEPVAADAVPQELRVARRNARQVTVRANREVEQWTWTPFDRNRPQTSVPLLESRLWLDSGSGLACRSILTVVTDVPDQIRLTLPAGAELSSARVGGRIVAVETNGSEVAIPVPGQMQGAVVVLDWSVSGNRLHAGELPRARPVGWSSTVETAVLSSASGMRFAQESTEVEIACRRMSGMLTAVERQSTRSFAIDNPLLASIRNLDARLERLTAADAIPAALQEECSSLRSRWARVHELIAVESSPPGAAKSPTDWLPGEDWAAGVPQEQVSYLTIDSPMPPDAFQLVEPVRHPYWLASAIVGLLALLLLAQHQGWTETVPDWLGKHPPVGLLLLGTFWSLQLEPRVVGVIIVLAAIALLGRTKPAPVIRSDSALIGPGR